MMIFSRFGHVSKFHTFYLTGTIIEKKKKKKGKAMHRHFVKAETVKRNEFVDMSFLFAS